MVTGVNLFILPTVGSIFPVGTCVSISASATFIRRAVPSGSEGHFWSYARPLPTLTHEEYNMLSIITGVFIETISFLAGALGLVYGSLTGVFF